MNRTQAAKRAEGARTAECVNGYSNFGWCLPPCGYIPFHKNRSTITIITRACWKQTIVGTFATHFIKVTLIFYERLDVGEFGEGGSS